MLKPKVNAVCAPFLILLLTPSIINPMKECYAAQATTPTREDDAAIKQDIEMIKDLHETNHVGVYEWIEFAGTSVSDSGRAVASVMRSSSTASVTYRIALLNDSKAQPIYRNMVYVSLAGNGGAAGLAAVQKARSVRPDPTRYDRGAAIHSRPETDAQQVLNAAVEGLLHFISGTKPLYVNLPPGVPAFQFAGMGRKVLICESNDWRGAPGRPPKWPFISFRYPIEENKHIDELLVGKVSDPRPAGQFIHFNDVKTSAAVEIDGGLDRAGYDVYLRKFGDEWIITNAELAFVE